MDKIIHLLKERNKFLTKFSALNTAEMNKMISGNFEGIDSFYATREGILDIVKQIEVMLEKQLAHSAINAVPQSTKKHVSQLLKERDEIVNQILSQDLEILECIDQAKNSIIQELQGLRKNRKAIGSYKSGKPESTLDEEA